MKKIIYTRPDGGISIVTPVINTRGEPEGFTEEDALSRALAKLPKDAINPQIVEPQVIPADRTFRNAWSHGGDRVIHDMPKCREIKRDQLRALRKPKMEALDVDYMRADEKGDAALKTQIAAQKQALRDATANPAIAAAATPEELKAIMPDVLK